MTAFLRPLLKPLLMLMALGAVASAHAQSGSPPTPPPVPPARVAKPATPRPATAPRPMARTLSGQRSLESTIEDAVFGAVTLAELSALSMTSALSPMAIAGLDMDRIQQTANLAAIEGQRAGMEGARAGLEGARAAMEGLRAGMDDAFGMSGTFSGSRSFRTHAIAPWKSDDPADSLYREARKALSGDAYQKAYELFQQIRIAFPKSVYAGDALYWQAFALQRIGGDDNLRKARSALRVQLTTYPKASTRSDAAALFTRIDGMLARSGDQEAIASLADRARNATSDGCPRAQDDERIDALNAVAQMDAEKAMPILKKVLSRREPCTQQLRRTAVWLVASRKQPDAAEMLLNVAKTDPDKEVREQAVFWMSNVPTEEATTMLIELAKKGDDLDLRKRAVYSLSRSKSPRALATIKEIALDGSADVELRGDAVHWYMSGPGRTADDAMTFLKDVYGRADDMRFKQRVLQTIQMRRSDDARAFLVEVAQNAKESMEIRRSAIWSLNGSGVTNAQLAQIYDRGTELEIRKQVIGVLSALRDNGGIEKLLDIARNEKNVELRKSAITYLSRTKDARALALLQEIINK